MNKGWGYMKGLYKFLSDIHCKIKETFHFRLCNHHVFRRLQRGSQKVPFYDVKDALLHGKRASFEVQKGVF